MTKDEEKESQKMYEEYAGNASEADIEKIAKNLDKMKKGPIAKIWDYVTSLWQMIKDPNAAWSSKALGIGALLYLVSPVDAIPDFVPFLGLTDDVGVITAVVTSLSVALSKYKKNNQNLLEAKYEIEDIKSSD
ncbi:MAG: YkvA family protein [Treponema sp.]